MNAAAISSIKQKFLEHLPDFRDFENPPQRLRDGELAWKHNAREKTREILGEYVDGRRQLTSDAESRKTLLAVMSLTNFLNWRDKAYLDDQLFNQDGDWLKFAQADICNAFARQAPTAGRYRFKKCLTGSRQKHVQRISRRSCRPTFFFCGIQSGTSTSSRISWIAFSS